jgi:hypothetical protein
LTDQEAIGKALGRGTEANTLSAEFGVRSVPEAHALAASIRSGKLLPGVRVIWAPQENFTESLLLLGDALGFKESDYFYEPLRSRQSTYQPSLQQIDSIRAQTVLDDMLYRAGFDVFTRDVAKLRKRISPAEFDERLARLAAMPKPNHSSSNQAALKMQQKQRPRFPNCDIVTYNDLQYESLLDSNTFRIRIPPGCERQQPWTSLLERRLVQPQSAFSTQLQADLAATSLFESRRALWEPYWLQWGQRKPARFAWISLATLDVAQLERVTTLAASLRKQQTHADIVILLCLTCGSADPCPYLTAWVSLDVIVYPLTLPLPADEMQDALLYLRNELVRYPHAVCGGLGLRAWDHGLVSRTPDHTMIEDGLRNLIKLYALFTVAGDYERVVFLDADYLAVAPADDVFTADRCEVKRGVRTPVQGSFIPIEGASSSRLRDSLLAMLSDAPRYFSAETGWNRSLAGHSWQSLSWDEKREVSKSNIHFCAADQGLLIALFSQLCGGVERIGTLNAKFASEVCSSTSDAAAMLHFGGPDSKKRFLKCPAQERDSDNNARCPHADEWCPVFLGVRLASPGGCDAASRAV